MQGCTDAGEAPLLIDAQVGDEVRHPEAEGAGSLSEALDRERVVGDDRGGRDQREAVRRQIHRAALAGGGVFGRQGAGEAVAELGGVGPEVLARGAGVAGDAHVVIAVGAAVGDQVEERLGAAHREARELDEGAVPERVEGGATAGGRRRGVLRPEADVGAQRAVLGLLADVPGDRAADAVVDVVGEVAGEAALAEHAAGVVADDDAAAAHVVLGLDTQIAAHLEAGIGARDVVEAVPVEGADLDILHRRGLHRHVGGLRPSNRDEPRGGSEKWLSRRTDTGVRARFAAIALPHRTEGQIAGRAGTAAKVRRIVLATWSAGMSRMHRWWPRRHTGL
jgi:hypothetical protein